MRISLTSPSARVTWMDRTLVETAQSKLRRELDGLAVWSMPVSVGPSFLAREQRRRISQTLRRDQALQSCQPMVVVMRAVVGLTTAGCGLELIGERLGPF